MLILVEKNLCNTIQLPVKTQMGLKQILLLVNVEEATL